MKLSAMLFALLAAAPLAAQTIDTLGGPSNPATSGRAKANLFRVDSTVLLTEIEFWLNVPGAETLTFFVHGHHSRSGAATLRFTQPVPVTGTGVAAWYSSGPIVLPLVCGNHYQIGVARTGTLTYNFTVVGSGGSPVSFGAWARGNTPSSPVPPTWTFSAGHDGAQYYQRLATFPIPGAAGCVGQPCANGAALAPRLVAESLLSLGTTANLQLVDAQASSPAVLAFVQGTTLPASQPLFGCPLWLDTTSAVTTLAFTSGAGGFTLPVVVPQNTAFLGFPLAAQAGVLGTFVSLTNALDLVVG